MTNPNSKSIPAPIEYSQSFKDALRKLGDQTGIIPASWEEKHLFRLFVPRVDFDGVEAQRKRLHERCKRLESALQWYAAMHRAEDYINDNGDRAIEALCSDSEEKK